MEILFKVILSEKIAAFFSVLHSRECLSLKNGYKCFTQDLLYALLHFGRA
jgi:hypothetical protein